MFSPHEGGPATATRSRRRQRPISSDSLVQQPKAKRQRLPLTEQTFVNPETTPEMFEVKTDRVPLLNNKQDGVENILPALPKKELSVRSKKPKASERVSKGDGSVVLAGNSAYVVSKLPALPDRLRTDSASRQHGIIFPSSGYSVCLTHTHVMVWPYAASNPSPETFVFTLPTPSRHASDPLPLATLVSPSASSEEPGLVVVIPATGRISYWESISSAATLDFLRQQRNGVEDTIPTLSSNELAVDIINAEPAGFILVMSSGRVAYASVRDAHGRPAISVQFLRSAILGSMSVGFLGSIRHALKHSALRGDAVIVRAGPVLNVGERTIVAATTKGKVQVWKVHRGGSHDALLEADVRDSIVDGIQQFDRRISSSESESVEVIDFTFVPSDIDRKYADTIRLSNAPEAGDAPAQQLLLLVALPNKKRCPYYLVELFLSRDEAHIGMVRPIASLTSLVDKGKQTTEQRPRVYLPKPAVVAYIVFDRAVVVASLAQPPDTPESQLKEESSRFLPATFEDIIDLRNDGISEIVGSGMEEPMGASSEPDLAGPVGPRLHRPRTKNPAVVLLIRGVGVVRVATADVDRFVGEKPPEVSARAKLEQAVFFGIKEDNPLVFDGKRELRFSSTEIGEAAMELSRDILGSKTTFTPTVPASLEANLRMRASYLHRLMSHLNSLQVQLSRRVRWRLLWDAEKMFTATNMWVLHERFLADRADEKNIGRKTIISEIVEYIHEDEKKNPNRDVGEVDRVRHFFVNDVWRMDLFIAWAYEVIKYVYKDNLLDDLGLTRLMYEGVEVNFRALNGAAEYRKDNLSFYGLGEEELESGILTAGYEGLPEPWTSTYFITNNAKRLVDLCCNWLNQFFPPSRTTPPAPDLGLMDSIRTALPNLTDRYLLTLLEHHRWTLTRESESERAYGDRCLKAYNEDRYAQVYRLKEYDLWDDAIELAKKHHSVTALAGIMVEEVRKLRKDATEAGVGLARAAEKRALALAKEQRIANYFETYGEPFAFAVYERLLQTEGIKMVLDFPGDKAGYVTRFLRTKPELAKISWINDVERENDVENAAETLVALGLDQEQQIWNKKIELSLGKLARLAEQKPAKDADSSEAASMPSIPGLLPPAAEPHADDNAGNGSMFNVSKIDRQLEIIKIQDLLYRWVLPSIATAVDESAELQLAMDNHATRISKRQKALMQIFEDAMSRLLRHAVLDAFALIDLLTLINVQRDDIPIDQDVFYLALVVADAGLDGEDRRQAQRLIWRRCFIRDDWTQINNTQLRDDESTTSILGMTSVYTTVYTLCLQRKIDDSVSFPVAKPSDTLGVYTDSTDTATATRFSNMEDAFCDKVLEAMRHEDTLLRRYIDKSRLEEWSKTAVEAAEMACQMEIDRLTALGGTEAGGRLSWRLLGSR